MEKDPCRGAVYLIVLCDHPSCFLLLVRPFDRTDSSSVDIGDDDKFNTESLISESFVAEFLAQQNPPPDGMRTCGNFMWSLDAFNKKLQFNPDEQAPLLSLEAIIGIAVGGFVILCTLVLLVMIGICISKKKKTIFCGQKTYQTFADQ